MTSRSGGPSAIQVASSIVRGQGIRGLYRGLTLTCMRDIGFGVYFATYEGTCRTFRQWRQGSSEIYLARSAQPQDIDHGSLVNEAILFENQLSAPELMVAGGLAGTMSWLSTFPLDTVKSRMQGAKWGDPSNAAFSPASSPYNNWWSALRHSYVTLGVRGLFAGLSPTLARYVYCSSYKTPLLKRQQCRAIPVNMVTFLAFEVVMALAR